MKKLIGYIGAIGFAAFCIFISFFDGYVRMFGVNKEGIPYVILIYVVTGLMAVGGFFWPGE